MTSFHDESFHSHAGPPNSSGSPEHSIPIPSGVSSMVDSP